MNPQITNSAISLFTVKPSFQKISKQDFPVMNAIRATYLRVPLSLSGF
jgi:hypothetical protein